MFLISRFLILTMSSSISYLNTSHSSSETETTTTWGRISGKPTQQVSKNSLSRHQPKKDKHPKNAFIVNFCEGEHLTAYDVEREFAPWVRRLLSSHYVLLPHSFGAILAVVMCTFDSCQAFVTMRDETNRTARESVSQLLKFTNGVMFVRGNAWMLCRPKEWKKLTNGTDSTLCNHKKGKTVDELTSIFRNFLRQNSSVRNDESLSLHIDPFQASQSSIFSTSMHSFSSLSLSKSSSSSAAGSCDSSVTITPFSVYPAQQSAGFIQLPPPYHLLPDTAFFRKTRIVPPPTIRIERTVPLAQKITDQYIVSARRGDFLSKTNEPRIVHPPQINMSKLELKCSWWNPVWRIGPKLTILILFWIMI